MVVVQLGRGRMKTILTYNVQRKLLGEIDGMASKYKHAITSRFTLYENKETGDNLWKSANGHLVLEEIVDTDIGAYIMSVRSHP